MHARALAGWLGCLLMISGCTTAKGEEDPQPRLDPLPTRSSPGEHLICNIPQRAVELVTNRRNFTTEGTLVKDDVRDCHVYSAPHTSADITVGTFANPYDVQDDIPKLDGKPTFARVPADWGPGYVSTSDEHFMIGRLYGRNLYVEVKVRLTPHKRNHNEDMLTLLSFQRGLITPAK